LVAPKPETGISMSLIDDARPGAPNQSLSTTTTTNTNQSSRASYIDQMLAPAKQPDWINEFKPWESPPRTEL
jgi:hypothetical protein